MAIVDIWYESSRGQKRNFFASPPSGQKVELAIWQQARLDAYFFFFFYSMVIILLLNYNCGYLYVTWSKFLIRLSVVK